LCGKSHSSGGYAPGADSLREASPSQKTCIAVGSTTADSGDTVPVSLAFSPLLPIVIRRVQFGGGRGRMPPLAFRLPRRSLHFVGQAVGESVIVAVAVKDGTAPITARHDAIDRTGELQTRRYWHRSGSFSKEKRTNPGHFTHRKPKTTSDPGEAPAQAPLGFMHPSRPSQQ